MALEPFEGGFSTARRVCELPYPTDLYVLPQRSEQCAGRGDAVTCSRRRSRRRVGRGGTAGAPSGLRHHPRSRSRERRSGLSRLPRPGDLYGMPRGQRSSRVPPGQFPGDARSRGVRQRVRLRVVPQRRSLLPSVSSRGGTHVSGWDRHRVPQRQPFLVARARGGGSARLEGCTTCHSQVDCTQCHSAVGGWGISPHGPGFDPDRAMSASREGCVACHRAGVRE